MHAAFCAQSFGVSAIGCRFATMNIKRAYCISASTAAPVWSEHTISHTQTRCCMHLRQLLVLLVTFAISSQGFVHQQQPHTSAGAMEKVCVLPWLPCVYRYTQTAPRFCLLVQPQAMFASCCRVQANCKRDKLFNDMNTCTANMCSTCIAVLHGAEETPRYARKGVQCRSVMRD